MSTNPIDHPMYDAILTMAAAIQVAEKDADAGLRSTAELIATTIRTQDEAGLAPSIVEPTLTELRAAIEAHFASRSAIVAAHLELGRVAKSMGATAEEWGPTWPCTNGMKRKRPARRLAAVA